MGTFAIIGTVVCSALVVTLAFGLWDLAMVVKVLTEIRHDEKEAHRTDDEVTKR